MFEGIPRQSIEVPEMCIVNTEGRTVDFARIEGEVRTPIYGTSGGTTFSFTNEKLPSICYRPGILPVIPGDSVVAAVPLFEVRLPSCDCKRQIVDLGSFEPSPIFPALIQLSRPGFRGPDGRSLIGFYMGNPGRGFGELYDAIRHSNDVQPLEKQLFGYNPSASL